MSSIRHLHVFLQAIGTQIRAGQFGSRTHERPIVKREVSSMPGFLN